MTQPETAELLRRGYVSQCEEGPWGEAAAAAVLLAFPAIAADARFTENVPLSGVDWEEVLADSTWSSAERFLIATAAALWLGRGRVTVDVAQVAWLDDRFFRVWHDMITAACTGRIPGQPGEEAAS